MGGNRTPSSSVLHRALDYVAIAETNEPDSISTAFIHFKVLLAMEDGDAAVQQLKRCMACTNFEPIYLTVRRVCLHACYGTTTNSCMHDGMPSAGGSARGVRRWRHRSRQEQPPANV